MLAYEACNSVEVATHWGDGYWTWHTDENDTKRVFRELLDRCVQELDGYDYKLCLTDSANNWRFAVLPTYKGCRTSVKKPLILQHIKQWLIDEMNAYFKPTLEGDDCMGILSTMKNNFGCTEKVIVSIDKDMKTIPGLFCRYGVGDNEINEISEEEADYWHLYQTLTGDVTDGYKGCPNVGPKKAEAILFGASPPWGTPREAWRGVVEAYEKAKLTEADALQQARVARILRASDYDFTKKEPILWTP